MKSAAIYARVSSDRQKEENTIASQTAALVMFAREQDFRCGILRLTGRSKRCWFIRRID